jgi:alpha-galactosidase
LRHSSSPDRESGTIRRGPQGLSTTYAFGVNERGELQPIYWGSVLRQQDPLGPARIAVRTGSVDASESVTPQEFAGWGQGIVNEPSLKITDAAGNRDLELHFVSYSIQGNTLNVVLKDIASDIFVTLLYRIDEGSGILARSALIENRGRTRVVVEQAASGTWVLPSHPHFQLSYLAGRWAGEFNLQTQPVGPGKTVLESRHGNTGQQNNPWFAIEAGETHDEESGEVWFGALAWSGSWQIAIEQDAASRVRVTGGYNPFDFGYALLPGESLDTPKFYGGYTGGGMGEASRILHRFELAQILPGAPKPRLRPVLYNSWEATKFNLSEANQMALADSAAKLGVERFVVDDGWFGHRDNDHAGLGDWQVNTRRFPNGLKPLIDHVTSLGMDFGLWVEPEMVNPDSDLYRKHPDWVLNFPGRPRSESRNQLVLNLARQDVRDYVFKVVDDLLSQNRISFLKWDYNRSWSEPGWPAIANANMPGEQQKVYVEFVDNLYAILAELRAKHPGVEIESCASGGGRVDLGILRYTDQVWPSDNMDAFDRLTIQNGFTYAYSPGLMMTWVTHSPDFSSKRVASLQYRFLSAMQGSLGIGDDLASWSAQDVSQATGLVAAYKVIRETIQRGSLYRLISPLAGSEFSATEYVAANKSQAVAFAFLHSSQMGRPFPSVYLFGLDPDATYAISAIAGTVLGAPKQASGSYWMHAGLNFDLHGDFQAAAVRLDRIQ